MMYMPGQEELGELQSFKQPRCLTLYVAFGESQAATGHGSIEFKKALRQAEAILAHNGASRKEAESQLKPAWELLNQRELWMPHHAGVAAFVHAKLFKYFVISDTKFQDKIIVKDGFYLEPLAQLVEENKHYFVLALSQKNVHLYEGDRYQLRMLELKDFANDMKSSLMLDDFQKERDSHTVGPTSMSKGTEVSHEQYDVSTVKKQLMLEFFRNIDYRIREVLDKDRAPLVISGVEFLLPIYRKANTYRGLLSESIPGNLEQARIDDIRQKAWRIVERATA